MEMVDPKQDPAWGSFEVHKKNLSLAQNDGGERDGREESDTQEVPENDSIRGRGKRGRAAALNAVSAGDLAGRAGD